MEASYMEEHVATIAATPDGRECLFFYVEQEPQLGCG